MALESCLTHCSPAFPSLCELLRCFQYLPTPIYLSVCGLPKPEVVVMACSLQNLHWDSNHCEITVSFGVYDFRVDFCLSFSASVFKESGNSSSGLSGIVSNFFFPLGSQLSTQNPSWSILLLIYVFQLPLRWSP